MEDKRWVLRFTLLLVVISWSVIICSASSSCSLSSSSNSHGKTCRDCIVGRLRHDCPSCVLMLRCMAKCLWGGGTKKVECQKRCDCSDDNNYFPRLVDCKNCMSNCKCSCIA